MFEKIITEISGDDRISDGVFDSYNENHLSVLKEYLSDMNIPENDINEVINNIKEDNLKEGKYPERQAYNNDGILVTFPTPVHKQRAIKRGTHFEVNPKKAQSNLFTPEAPATTDLPVSSTPVPDDAQKDMVGVTTSAAPDSSAAPTPPEPEIPEEPTELPPPVEKTPEEKEADKNAIKTILTTNDLVMEEVCNWLLENSPKDLKEKILRR